MSKPRKPTPPPEWVVQPDPAAAPVHPDDLDEAVADLLLPDEPAPPPATPRKATDHHAPPDGPAGHHGGTNVEEDRR